MKLTFILFIILISLHQTTARVYQIGEKLDVWATRIGPYSNPLERYDYYSKVPFCLNSNSQNNPEIEYKPLRLGEALRGDRYSKLDSIQLKFLETSQDSGTDLILCESTLTFDKIQEIYTMIEQQYTYELVVDGLPSRQFLGTFSVINPMLYTHTHFEIAYNKEKRIVEFNVKQSKPIVFPNITKNNEKVRTNDEEPVRNEVLIGFTYSVEWIEKDIKYSNRHQKYYESFEAVDLELHWNSIIHASITVLILASFFSFLILRIVKKDFHDHSESPLAYGNDAEPLSGDDFGWKYVRYDVFRGPLYCELLSAMIGIGIQLVILCVFLITLGVFDVFHPLNRGTLITTSVILYSITAGIAGFVSASIYKQIDSVQGGRYWMRTAVFVGVLLCSPLILIFGIANILSIVSGSSRIIPLWSTIIVFILYILITFPLTIIGSIFGKNWTHKFQPPCPISSQIRSIPETVWYRRPILLALMSGSLPFLSIYLELYYVLQTIWGYKVFSLYEVLALVFFMLCLVVSITAISAVYFQLTVEDYRWHWGSFCCGGSVALYVMCYTCLFLMNQVEFNGTLSNGMKSVLVETGFWLVQILSILTYSVVFSSAFFLMFGAVGFFSVRFFVIFLFSNLPKTD